MELFETDSLDQELVIGSEEDLAWSTYVAEMTGAQRDRIALELEGRLELDNSRVLNEYRASLQSTIIPEDEDFNPDEFAA
jgi:hypothetical protein